MLSVIYVAIFNKINYITMYNLNIYINLNTVCLNLIIAFHFAKMKL